MSTINRNKISRKVNVVATDEKGSSEDEQISQEKDNKISYMCSLQNTFLTNPFFITLHTNEAKLDCLLDTGADISIMSSSLVQNSMKITTNITMGNVRSACGTSMNLIGMIQNLKLRTEDNLQMIVSPYILQEGPPYVILGKDFILKYPDILSNCIEKASKGIRTVQNCGNVETKKISNQYEIKYEDMFKSEIREFNVCSEGIHRIETGSQLPVAQRSERVPIQWVKPIEDEIKKNLDLGIIRKSSSPWCSRIVPISKPDGTLRMCIDYRPLNQITVKDKYPIPRIDEIIDAMSGSKIFSTLDATSGYYQIEMNEEDKKKTAFAFKGGLYEFNRMPFGLCNAPATFQRAMDSILEEERGRFVIPYLDDIIIFSKSMEEHKIHVDVVMKKLKNAGICLNKKKCKFFQEEIKILGTIITEGIIKPDPEKIETIVKYPMPTTIREVRSFLGTANYCSEFIPRYTEMMKPIFDLLKNETKNSQKSVSFNEEARAAFIYIKEKIADNLQRTAPDFDKEFILITDASDIGIGAILLQKDQNGKECMIAAFSKNLDKAQKNYSVTDKELLGIVKGIEHFRHYLLGKEFLLRTDHKALAYLWDTKNQNSRVQRSALKLQEYTFKVEYIKGEDNIADGVSRITKINMINEKRYVDNYTERKEILRGYHETLGHGSPNSMKFLIKERYNWANMNKDIDEYVSGCGKCLKSGGPIVNTKYNPILTKNPNELWEVDLIGRIPSEKKNKFIFVAIDHFSKWIETRVISNKTEDTIIQCIKELIFDKHGIPERILSDGGLEFNNRKVNNLTKKNNFCWEFASPAHHQTIGCVERVNQTLWRKIQKLSDFGLKSWEKAVPLATKAVNLSYNRAIGTAPYCIKTGLLPELPIDKQLGQETISINQHKLSSIINKAKRSYYNNFTTGKRSAPNEFQIGDRVLVFKKNLSNKLKSNWIQGFVIDSKIPPDAYIVKSKTSTLRLNKCHLKLDKSCLSEGML